MTERSNNSSSINPLAEEYLQAVERPADVVYDFRKQQQGEGNIKCLDLPLFKHANNNDQQQHVAQQAGVEDAFVIFNVLSPVECEQIIAAAEEDGIIPPRKEAGTLRTAKRTDNYQNEQLSLKISDRLQSILIARLSSNLPEETQNHYCGEFHSIHTNWRIVRYDPPSSSNVTTGDAFPAHQDQMDTVQILDKTTGTKDFLVSTHTLLINLTPLSNNNNKGGATRFYPRAKVAGKSPGQYSHAVDVWLPQGAAIVFPQLGMVHAGQPVADGHQQSKYIAQAGILRTLPQGRVLRPNVFRLGPGLAELAGI